MRRNAHRRPIQKHGPMVRLQRMRGKIRNAEFDLICRNCSNNFAIKEAHIMEIPKFSLNLTRKKEIRQNVASLEDIRALLTDLGFDIAIPGLTIGQKSGMQHHFSLIAKKQVSGKKSL